MSNIVIYHNNLCPDIWDENYNLNSGIRLNLLKIAKDFYEKTKFEAPILDIYFMGSMASFNWNVESDIDVHVVIDLKSLNMPEETSEKMAKLVGSQWNSEHDILIKGHKVEMNIQSLTAEKPYVNGIYSLIKNVWIKRPSKQNFSDINTPAIQLKYNGMKKYILDTIATGDREKLKGVKDYIDAFRQYGLDNDGELSIENITYKLLRTKGIIQQLKDAISSIYDKQLSIREVNQSDLKQRHPIWVGGDLSQLTLDNLNALKHKSVRLYNAAKNSENQEMCNREAKDYIIFRDEIKRRLEIINRPINEAGYNDTMTDDEKDTDANLYFTIGQEDEENSASSYCWIWSRADQGLRIKKGGTHGINFGHEIAGNTFKGWYDKSKDMISVVFPDSELRKLGNKRPTVDDIPTNVFNKLISKFGKNNQFVVFENKSTHDSLSDRTIEELCKEVYAKSRSGSYIIPEEGDVKTVNEHVSRFYNIQNLLKNSGSSINKKMRLIENGLVPSVTMNADDNLIINETTELMAAFRLNLKTINVNYVTYKLPLNESIDEIFKVDLPCDIEKLSNGDYTSNFKIGDENYTVNIKQLKEPNTFRIEFFKIINRSKVNDFKDIYTQVDSMYGNSNLRNHNEVYSQVLSIFNKFIMEKQPEKLIFDIRDEQRNRIYSNIINKYIGDKYDFMSAWETDAYGEHWIGTATRKNKEVKEGFGGNPDTDKAYVKGDRWTVKYTSSKKTPLMKENLNSHNPQDLFSMQDEKAERIVHHKDWKCAYPRLIIEGTGDIYRELTKYSSGWYDIGYINEKLRRLDDWFSNKRTGHGHYLQDMKDSMVKNPELHKQLADAYNELPFNNKGQYYAKMLSRDIAKGDSSAILWQTQLEKWLKTNPPKQT